MKTLISQGIDFFLLLIPLWLIMQTFMSVLFTLHKLVYFLAKCIVVKKGIGVETCIQRVSSMN